jgi:Repeats of unknown function (DUF5649)
MKKAPNVKLSLRKLFIAMLAVGPVAILPGPLWATMPTQASITNTAGTATISSSGTQATITASDRAILTWGITGPDANFNIGVGETYNFVVPSGGSVLNKVSNAAGLTAATIDGTLVSTGKVFVLSSSGNIRVGGGAAINTAGGLILSTLGESSDFPFTVNGNLTFAGTSNGDISIGATGAAPTILGNLDAAAGTVSLGGAAVTGNLVLRSVTASAALALASNVASSVSGTLSAITNNGAITQTNGLTVTGVTSLSSGTAAVTLANAGNNFSTVTVAAGGAVSLADANDIVLGASTIGTTLVPAALSVSALGNITTSGAVATSGVATLASTGVGAVNYGTLSSAATINAATANGTVTLNTVGNVTIGTVTAGGPLQSVTVTSIGTGYTGNPTVTVAGDATGLTAVGTSAGVSSVAVAAATAATYTLLPVVTFADGGAAPSTVATVVAALTATSLSSIAIIGGGNYTGTPTFAITGGGGTGATAVAVIDANKKIAGVQITNPGTGYTSTPTVTITGTVATGQQAPVLVASLTPTTATFSVTAGGAGYTGSPANITVTPVGGNVIINNFTAVVPVANALPLGALTTNSTTLFSAVPAVAIASTGGTSPTVAAKGASNAGSAVSIASSGVVTTNGNIFGSAVNLTGANITNTAGTITTGGLVSANATAGDLTLGTTITGSLNVAALGNITQRASTGITTVSGQTITASAATVNLSEPTNSLPATKLILNSTLGNVSVASANASSLNVGNSTVKGDLILKNLGAIVFGTGSGTLSEAISVGGNLQAQTTGTSLSGVTVTNNGNATAAVTGATYSGNPAAVSITGGSGTGASATPTFNANGQLTGFTVTNGGSGYTAKPTVALAGGAGTSGTITANVTGSTITDDRDVTLLVAGALNLVTNGGNIALTSTNGSGRGYGAFGQLNANTTGLDGKANVDVQERTTIGVGNVTANVLNLRSNTGGIVFQPTNIPTLATNASGITTITANAASSGATITQTTAIATTGGNSQFNSSGGTILDNTTNSLGGNIQVINGANNVLTTNSNFTLQNATTVTGTNKLVVNVGQGDALTNQTRTLTVNPSVNATNVTLNSVGSIAVNGGTFANLTLSAGGQNNAGAVATAISQGAGALTVNNTLTTSAAAGAVNLAISTNNNTIAKLVVGETPGGTSVSTTGSLNLSGTTTGAVTATAGTQATTSMGPAPTTTATSSNYGITLGNLSASALTLTAQNGTTNSVADGVSGTIAQSAGTTLRTESGLSATTFGGNITLANAGNNFGQINLSTGTPAGASITLVEGGTAKIGTLNTTGPVTLTSTFGSIIEDPSANVSLIAGSLMATAANGSVNLGGTTKVDAFTTTGTIPSISLKAAGAAAVLSSGNLALGAISANSLTATSGDTLTQTAAQNIYGVSTFTAVNGITLDNAANNFGPVSVTISGTNKNVVLAENNTLNLRKVAFTGPAGNGTFTASSALGDIVDSGLAGVIIGGRAANEGTGLVTLTASKGNVVLDDPTTDIATTGGVSFNAKDVTLSVLGTTPLTLGAAGLTSVATGNLSASSATGSITNAGNLTISGLASFQAGIGSISLTQSANQFGTLRFSTGGTLGVVQANDMKILTGSSAMGLAQFQSGGNISVVNVGGVVTLINAATMSATGSITLPKLLQANGVITLNAAGTKDLGALSLSNDLGGKAPLQFGSGTYVPPTP